LPNSRRALACTLFASAAWLAGACGSKAGLPIPPTCASYQAGAVLSPLDVFISFDISGSMTAMLANGKSKFETVSGALSQFLHAKDSAGIGVTIAFFPQVDANVPERCSTDDECGAAQACLGVSACFVVQDTRCHTNADCLPGDSCEQVGTCTDDPKQLCFVNGNIGCAAGTCVPLGLCPNHFACDEASYEPALAVQVLPEAADSVMAQVNTQVLGGGTTTLPALKGSSSAARAFAQTHPDHKVIVLLATDGLPTHCDPAVDPIVTEPASGIPKLVSTAEAATQAGIDTFVIGVFTPEEAEDAEQNLSQIAKAGGSDKAFIISTSDNVGKNFLDALTKIRRAARACERTLPTVDGTTLDATQLVVRIETPSGAAVEVERRDDAAGCDATNGGFYFDRDPFGPIPPERFTLCPASCNLTDQGTHPVIVEVDCDRSRWIQP
jgi:hypothetical protein